MPTALRGSAMIASLRSSVIGVARPGAASSAASVAASPLARCDPPPIASCAPSATPSAASGPGLGCHGKDSVSRSPAPFGSSGDVAMDPSLQSFASPTPIASCAFLGCNCAKCPTSNLARPIEGAGDGLPHEIAVRLSVGHHLFAIRMERVVDDPFGGIERVIVLETELAKALGNRLEAWAF